ncbi:glycosyltransferase family 2 protein [Alicyclobacillus ferrooxydans]|uniref:glycosyltransferase family 2 protein n=1 Tax=Alicyclobacillus ferrooxydans TaxID=471514 RepID=UPI0006D58A86|nr:glycosyltransferase family 2 protein [Alicyclobacillus ferrooxydans]
MGTPPSVSIIINNFNYAKYVRDAVDSALHQTYALVEVIVVDDKSTDDSLEVLRRYGSSIKLVALDKNLGQGGAMNAGYEQSTGDIVFFLDADDRLASDIVSRVVEVMLHHDYSKVHFPLSTIHEDGTEFEPIQLVPQTTLPSGNVTRMSVSQERTWPPTSGNAYTRKSLRKIMPIPEVPFRIAADVWLNVLAPYTGPINAVHSVGGFYRVHNENHSNFNRIVSIEEQEQLALNVMSRAHVVEAWANKNVKPKYRHRLVDPWPDSVRLLFLLSAIKSPCPAITNVTPVQLFVRGIRASRKTKVKFDIRSVLWFLFWFGLLLLLPRSQFTDSLSRACLTGQKSFKASLRSALSGREAS